MLLIPGKEKFGDEYDPNDGGRNCLGVAGSPTASRPVGGAEISLGGWEVRTPNTIELANPYDVPFTLQPQSIIFWQEDMR